MTDEDIDKRVAEFKESIVKEINSLISECGTCRHRTACERVLAFVINETIDRDIDPPQLEGRFLEFKNFITSELVKIKDNKALYNKCRMILCDLLSKRVCCGYP
jgi:hypothetical protein